MPARIRRSVENLDHFFVITRLLKTQGLLKNILSKGIIRKIVDFSKIRPAEKKIPTTNEVFFTKIKKLRERDARPLIQKLHLM